MVAVVVVTTSASIAEGGWATVVLAVVAVSSWTWTRCEP